MLGDDNSGNLLAIIAIVMFEVPILGLIGSVTTVVAGLVDGSGPVNTGRRAKPRTTEE